MSEKNKKYRFSLKEFFKSFVAKQLFSSSSGLRKNANDKRSAGTSVLLLTFSSRGTERNSWAFNLITETYTKNSYVEIWYSFILGVSLRQTSVHRFDLCNSNLWASACKGSWTQSTEIIIGKCRHETNLRKGIIHRVDPYHLCRLLGDNYHVHLQLTTLIHSILIQ